MMGTGYRSSYVGIFYGKVALNLQRKVSAAGVFWENLRNFSKQFFCRTPVERSTVYNL